MLCLSIENTSGKKVIIFFTWGVCASYLKILNILKQSQFELVQFGCSCQNGLIVALVQNSITFKTKCVIPSGIVSPEIEEKVIDHHDELIHWSQFQYGFEMELKTIKSAKSRIAKITCIHNEISTQLLLRKICCRNCISVFCM